MTLEEFKHEMCHNYCEHSVKLWMSDEEFLDVCKSCPLNKLGNSSAVFFESKSGKQVVFYNNKYYELKETKIKMPKAKVMRFEFNEDKSK